MKEEMYICLVSLWKNNWTWVSNKSKWWDSYLHIRELWSACSSFCLYTFWRDGVLCQEPLKYHEQQNISKIWAVDFGHQSAQVFRPARCCHDPPTTPTPALPSLRRVRANTCRLSTLPLIPSHTNNKRPYHYYVN